MKKTFALLTVLALLICVSALAEGILPVLTTPAPETITAISFHAIKKAKAPAATCHSDGSYRYPYESNVTCDDWELFGKALAEDGWMLDTSSVIEAMQKVLVRKGAAALDIEYNPHEKTMYVTYPGWVQPLEYDGQTPYTVKEDTVSILPELTQTVSLETATARNSSATEKTQKHNGYRYRYYNVPYSCYNSFSNKLGEEGFSLVSYEEAEDGYVNIIVEKDDITLTIAYPLEGGYTEIIYPYTVYPRARHRYSDYTAVKTGETVTLADGVSAELTGWKAVDAYTGKSYYYNWIPTKTVYDTHKTTDGIFTVVVTFEVHYNLPSETYNTQVVPRVQVEYGKEEIGSVNGFLSYGDICTKSTQTVSGAADVTYMVGIDLTEEQMVHPENLVLTFTNYDQSVYYVWCAELDECAETEKQSD